MDGGVGDRRVPAELGQETQASSCLSKGTPLASRVAQGKGRSLQLSLTLPFAFFDGIPETLKHTDPAHFAEIKNTTVPKY